MPKEIDHSHTDEIVCPYCGYEFQHSYEFDGESGHVECEYKVESIEALEELRDRNK